MGKESAREVVKYRLAVGDQKPLTIVAKEYYSAETIEVQGDEQYEIRSEDNQEWKDWKNLTTPKGYFNIFSWIAGQRVKGVKCFCLCGVFNHDDASAFAIGLSTTVKVSGSSQDIQSLNFFANDSAKHYGNNSGEIKISVKRMK